jgi:hypothetical protein
MPYIDVMPVTAQPQHNKWRKLPYDSQPLPTIQAREQLVAFVADSELCTASADWRNGLTKREAPTATPDSRRLNCSQVTEVSDVIGFSLDSWRKARRLIFSNIPDGRF